MAAGSEDCNDADFLRVDQALRLSLSKGKMFGAGQSALSRLENHVLGNGPGLGALDEALLRSADALIKSKDKYRLVIDVDSTEEPAYGQQEGCVYNGHFGKTCFNPSLPSPVMAIAWLPSFGPAMYIRRMAFWIS